MAAFSFADRYAEAGIAPTAEMISARQAPAERIVKNASPVQILDLARVYYGHTGLDLTWFREEFSKEDPTFSLVNNEREARVLSASMLSALFGAEQAKAILAVIAGNVAGHRPAAQAEWLLRDAEEALGKLAVAHRRPKKIDTTVVPTVTTKLSDEVAALPANDWQNLIAVLSKIRTESQSSAKTTSGQVATALTELSRQVQLQREESQMLWWLVGGHSRSLSRSFEAFSTAQAALVGALDLAALTTVTLLGPVAAPAMLERVIALAKRPKGGGQKDLASAVDGLSRCDLESLPTWCDAIPAPLAPVSAALSLARSAGLGAWHVRFQETSGFEATVEFEPLALATQLYRESLLGQLL